MYGEMSLSQAIDTLKKEKQICICSIEKGKCSDHTENMIMAIDTVTNFIDNVVSMAYRTG